MFNHLRGRIAATRTPSAAPDKPPGHGHDDVQLLVADGPGDTDPAREYWIGDRVRVISDPPDEVWTRYIGAVVSKRELHDTDAHEYGVLFDDEHETVLHFWTSQLEAAPEEGGGIEPAGDDDGWVPLSVREARWREAADRGASGDPEPVEKPRRPPLPAPVYLPGALGPTPLAEELRRDRELLLAANGRLAARVRRLEAQLRAAGIEPAARE